jgi:hypothetical protein
LYGTEEYSLPLCVPALFGRELAAVPMLSVLFTALLPGGNAVTAKAAPASFQPETWIACPTHLMRHQRRFVGPAELVPDWWTRRFPGEPQ